MDERKWRGMGSPHRLSKAGTGCEEDQSIRVLQEEQSPQNLEQFEVTVSFFVFVFRVDSSRLLVVANFLGPNFFGPMFASNSINKLCRSDANLHKVCHI